MCIIIILKCPTFWRRPEKSNVSSVLIFLKLALFNLFWIDGDIEQKKMVQKLVFARPVVIHPDVGVGTADLSLPFRLLKESGGKESRLVDALCENWNHFYEFRLISLDS